MSTKRTPINRPPRGGITPEAVRLFAQVAAIKSADRETWEANGGKRRKYFDLSVALHAELGLHPWEDSPLDAVGDALPAWMGPAQEADWRRTHRQLLELQAANGSRGYAFF
jgi:hypothetical protein